MNLKKLALAAVLALPLGLVAVSGCSKKEAAPEVKTYSTTAVVKGFQAEGKVILLDHAKIEGYMDAMLMGFELKDPALGQGLKNGDKVAVSMEVTGGEGPIITVLTKQ